MRFYRDFLIATAAAAALLSGGGGVLRADGWHNAALATSSLEEWLKDLKQGIPDIEDRLQGSELRAGTNIEDLKNRPKPPADKTKTPKQPPGGNKIASNLTPEQKALLGRKAADCCEVLALMDPKNILPQEFPDFQLKKIPEYRQAARQMLKLMGREGAAAVAARLRADLMGMNQYFDVTLTEKYADDMLDVLREAAKNGDLSAQDIKDLADATQGQKNPEQAALAQKVQLALSEMVDLPMLLDWHAQTNNQKARSQLSNQIRKRAGEASVGELLRALEVKDLDASFKKQITAALQQRIAEAREVELLRLLEQPLDAQTHAAVANELGKRSPKYAEVKDDLREIWSFASSSNPEVASAARHQTANAFQRAPMTVCLDWLASNDKPLRSLIWEQVDGRIARATDDIKAGYRTAAVAVLGDRAAGVAKRQAALELVARINDRQAVGDIVPLISQMPRELWPTAGATLEKLTGQNFGPKEGDSVADVATAISKWREWWKSNGGRP